MTTPNIVYSLTRVCYNEANQEIVCSFSNAHATKSQRYAFFPTLLTTATALQLFSLLSSQQSKKIQIVETRQKTLKVLGASFSLLQDIQQQLYKKTTAVSLLLAPERQFLLQQEWGFFDAFLFHSGPQKVTGLLLPTDSLGFLPVSFKETVGELLESHELETAQKLCESLVWSNVLKVPLSSLSPSPEQREKGLLENQFFLAGIICSDKQLVAKKESVGFSLPLSVFENTTEFDFANSVSLLCTRAYYNLGLETINCTCCKPENPASPNLFPHSLVKVRVVSNGFFFDSLFEGFACSFHALHLQRSARERRQQEFGLSFPPIGPFQEGQIVECPLSDAEKLEQESNGVIMGLGKKVYWFCKKKESMLSKTLNAFSRQIRALEHRNQDLEKKALVKDKVLGLWFLEKNPFFFFQKKALFVLNELFGKLPCLFFHTPSPTPFFSTRFAELVLIVQQYSLKRFVTFSQSNGFRVLPRTASGKVFIQKSNGFGLAKAFAQSEKMPVPQVVDWHFWLPVASKSR
ncbi:hypothetical protein KKE06_05710 [Candidatus Micrarchaeota archaeon]|nr:hypothetical protein [Candidatus Micrarchaeota archaeon]MBU1930792.1 hypothetical protein [Candidatus Micrarchaeota archaeon]